MSEAGNIQLEHGVDYIAVDPASVEVFSLAERVAKFNVPVLITGETGTGKECIAKYIHCHSAEKSAAYVGVNCAAIPENMLEAMLFGYEKGAFTGAINSQPGKLELANGGTLLLDEIGDMPIALQAKLLRVLQEQEVERLGSHKKIPLDLRLIASTNKDLEQEIAAGRFRQDLYYRLSVIPIHITPLRSRVQDIMPLVQLFLRKYHALIERKPTLMPGARIALESYSWPGNVRELENVVQRGLILCGNGNLTTACFGLPNARAQSALMPQAEGEHDGPHDGCARAIKRQGRMAESQYILDLLRRNQGNKSKTAESLGITPRALRYRLASMREQGFDTGFF